MHPLRRNYAFLHTTNYRYTRVRKAGFARMGTDYRTLLRLRKIFTPWATDVPLHHNS